MDDAMYMGIAKRAVFFYLNFFLPNDKLKKRSV